MLSRASTPPAGAAEPGGSFARTAIDELAEETGIEVEPADLVPFGCLSEAEAHTIRYPNGDVTHCFALLFLAERWQGGPTPNRDEATEAGFFELDALPEQMHAPTDWARSARRLPTIRHLSGALRASTFSRYSDPRALGGAGGRS